MKILLVTLLFCVGCASSGPQPGTLNFIRLQQQQELATACYKDIDPRKTVYYRVGNRFVNERSYCNIKAQQAVQTIAFRR